MTTTGLRFWVEVLPSLAVRPDPSLPSAAGGVPLLTQLAVAAGLEGPELDAELASVHRQRASLAAYEVGLIERKATLGARQPFPFAPGARTDTRADRGISDVVDDDPSPQAADDFLPDEVAVLLGMSVPSTRHHVDYALTVVRQLPVVWRALADGRIDEPRAKVMVKALGHQAASFGGPVPDGVVDALAVCGVGWAERGCPPTTLRERLDAALIAADPAAADRRRELTQRGADVRVLPTGDGLADLRALHVDTAEAELAWAQVDAYARAVKAEGDGRPIGQIRVSVVLSLIMRPWEARDPAVAHVTVDADLADLLLPDLEHLVPADAAHADPERVDRDMVDAEVDGQELVTVELVDPEPADPEPADPEPADPEPADPEPANPELAASGSGDAGVASADPSWAGTGQPGSGASCSDPDPDPDPEKPSDTDPEMALSWRDPHVDPTAPDPDQLRPAGSMALPPDPSAGAACRPVTARREGAGWGRGLPGGGSQVGHVGGSPVSPAAVRELLQRIDAVGLTHPENGQLVVRLTGPDRRLLAVATPAELEAAATAGCGIGPPPAAPGYTPTAAQYRYLRARDRHCRFPGCRQPGHHTDADHVTPYDHHDPARGGQTCVSNLVLLCRHHHRLKTHHTGWAFRLDPDGALHVTTPGGTTRTTRPPATDEVLDLTAERPAPHDLAADPPPF